MSGFQKGSDPVFPKSKVAKQGECCWRGKFRGEWSPWLGNRRDQGGKLSIGDFSKKILLHIKGSLTLTPIISVNLWNLERRKQIGAWGVTGVGRYMLVSSAVKFRGGQRLAFTGLTLWHVAGISSQ